MANFTKGPWHIEIFRHDGYPYVCDKSHNHIAFALTTDLDYDYTDESMANARLIAKAPEMYDWLKLVVNLIDEAPELQQKLIEFLEGIDNAGNDET